MEDGKRETAVSLLPLVPDDRDSGRTYTCRVLNPAAPAGRQTSITINVQRKCPVKSYRLILEDKTTNKQKCHALHSRPCVTWSWYFVDPPSVTLSVQPQTVMEGAKVLFICSASASPEITGYR